jgi:hypothetical protein
MDLKLYIILKIKCNMDRKFNLFIYFSSGDPNRIKFTLQRPPLIYNIKLNLHFFEFHEWRRKSIVNSTRLAIDLLKHKFLLNYISNFSLYYILIPSFMSPTSVNFL